MQVQELAITKLIPQRPPFVMVDRVLSCDEREALTAFIVRRDNILLDGEVLSTAGVIEHMAQSCAALMGCIDVLHGEPIKLGFIGDVRDAQIIRQPHCEEQLHTQVHVLEDMLNLLLTTIEVKVGDEVIATARMKLAKTNIVANLT